MQTQTEVIIVGAGPTGLMAGLLLKRAGIDVVILDRNSAPVQESRAGIVTARSLELFASLGLDGALLARGTITTNIDFIINGERAAGFDYDRAKADDTAFPFMLMIPQSETEEVLLEALDAAGLRVRRSCEVTAVHQDATHVSVQLQHPTGNEEIQGRYLLGADGAHSVVRHQLALNFAGERYPQRFLLGDVAVDWQRDPSRFQIFLQGDRIGLYLPLHGASHARVMTTLAAQDALPDDATPSLEQLSQAFSQVAGCDVTLRDPLWLAQFQTQHRMVDHYRVERIFLAGDAAHIHSPAGGQGMNTGLQDAANLAWKLALVLKQEAPPSLLDTYQQERLPVARDVLDFTDRLFSFAAGQQGWLATLRDHLVPLVAAPTAALDTVQQGAFRRFAQLDMTYEENPLVSFDGGSRLQPGAGMRLPDAQLSRRMNLHGLLNASCFTLLALSRQPLSPAVFSDLQQTLSGLQSDRVQVRIAARLNGGLPANAEAVERPDVFSRLGMEEDNDQGLIVVRPDGYIAWRSDMLDYAGCGDFLASLGLAN
ncbi:hypothetical protein BTJ39_08095 [Izhakiella australiensis]|uniref:Alkyl hydroperoxide reductase subunit F n=1 Tax=Izhakiella australiensis TaxID=1926881 RepID=A0A1S8YNN5_9GAMM|nr:FAD-dependent monooxygenase [Izhakiella australiensis]OON40366.1 hypothetical protein BTJ39_08095 [Izhakiella australiensis]